MTILGHACHGKKLNNHGYFQRNHPEFKTSKPDRPLVLAVSPSPQRTEFLRYFTLSHGSQVGGQYFATKLSPSILFYCKYVISQNVKVNQELSEHTHRQQTTNKTKKGKGSRISFKDQFSYTPSVISSTCDLAASSRRRLFGVRRMS